MLITVILSIRLNKYKEGFGLQYINLFVFSAGSKTGLYPSSKHTIELSLGKSSVILFFPVSSTIK